MRHKFIISICITTCFVGLYFLLRNLPNTQCDILHYEVTKVTANGVEMCANEPTGLIDLDRVKFPGSLEISSEKNGLQGENYEGQISIAGPKGDFILPHEVAITHAAKIHFIAINKDLSDYHHLHPEPQGATGGWVFNFTPKKHGLYQLYAECVPLRTKKQLIVKNTIDVKQTEFTNEVPSITKLNPSFQTHWEFAEKRPEAESWVNFSIALESDGETPILLEEFMDAYSHVVAFRRGTVGYAHIHPIGTVGAYDPIHPEFKFTFFTGSSGSYRLWAQFQLDGKSVFIPFDIDVI